MPPPSAIKPNVETTFAGLTALLAADAKPMREQIHADIARMRGTIDAVTQTIASMKEQRSKIDCKADQAAKPEPDKPPVAASKPKPLQQASKLAKKPKAARETVVDEDDGGPELAAAAPLAIGIMGIGMGGGGYSGGQHGRGYRSGGSGGSSRRY